MNLTKISIIEALNGLKSKNFSSVELTNAHLDRMEQAKSLNAYVTVTKEQALDMAKSADGRIAKGEMRKLDGIPVAVKDLFCTKNVRTTACSGILRNFVPPYESTVTAKMWEAGAVMLGKVNMDDAAMGSSNKTSYFGPVVNPLTEKNSDKKFVPGGSSGGSAAAVAAFMAMGAFASDTGGSIRQPAAYTGIVGIKPTYGRCSRFGMIAFASSLDQAGMFARNVADSALLLETIMGYDEKDSTSVKMEVPDLSGNINKNVKGMRIGIPKEYYNEKLDQEINKSWQQTAKWLEEAGAEVVEISLPHTKYALPVYYIIAPAEASSNLSRYDGVRFGYRAEGEFASLDEMYEMTRTEGFGEEVKRRIMIGTYVLSAGYYDAYYKKAQRVRALIAKDFRDNFDNKIDAIITPTAPTTAFGLDDVITDSVTMYLNDIFTIPASLAGLPAMNVPVGVATNGMPIGIHIISKPFREDIAINVAATIEEKAEFDKIEKRFII